MPAAMTKYEISMMLIKISYLFSEYGFDNISMDEVSKRIKLSKATLYKYFKSKEEIVNLIVNDHLEILKEINLTTEGELSAILESAGRAYTKAVLATAVMSPVFVEDMQHRFPAVYDNLSNGMSEFYVKLGKFHDEAREKGYFRAVNMDLVIEQAKCTLPAIFTPSYIIQHQTTLPDLICDYYRLLLCQVLNPEHLDALEDEKTYAFVDHLLDLLSGRF